jgi:hypothetical protein
MTTKQIEISTGFLSEEFTLKIAVQNYMKMEQKNYGALKMVHGKFVPNQHIYIANINNCKSLLEKLNKKGE